MERDRRIPLDFSFLLEASILALRKGTGTWSPTLRGNAVTQLLSSFAKSLLKVTRNLPLLLLREGYSWSPLLGGQEPGVLSIWSRSNMATGCYQKGTVWLEAWLWMISLRNKAASLPVYGMLHYLKSLSSDWFFSNRCEDAASQILGTNFTFQRDY